MAEDIGVDAVKIGMLGTTETIEAVERALDLIPGAPVVLDPVMVAESGARAARRPTPRDALRERIVPRATVVTPNLPEARVLAGLDEDPGPEELARAVHALGPGVRGGHRRPPRARRPTSSSTASGSRDPGRAPPGRRGPRLGLHPLLDARGAPGARADAARGGAARPRRSASRGGARRLRGIGRAPARWTCSAWRRPERARALWHNRRAAEVDGTAAYRVKE